MSLIRMCDAEECENPALFMVGVYDMGGEKLADTADVCGVAHARQLMIEWLAGLNEDAEHDS